MTRGTAIKDAEAVEDNKDWEKACAYLQYLEQKCQRQEETTAKLRRLHKRNKVRWRHDKNEIKSLRDDLRAMRRLLARRGSYIGELKRQADELIGLQRTGQPGVEGLVHWSRCGSRKGAMFFRPAGMLGRVAGLLTRFPSMVSWSWKKRMRLGVARQYPPQFIRPEKLPGPKNRDLPGIVVVTPSFNQAAYLERAMQSILDQNYPLLEYVVMDGGSSDHSAEIIERYADRLHFWQSALDNGQSAAIAEGFKKSQAPIMAWVNSDDLLMPGALAYVGNYFATHPEVDLIYGNRFFVDENGYDVGHWFLPPHDEELLLYADFIPQETAFWRRSLYEKVGGLDPSFQFALDWDLFVRMQKAGGKFKRLPYALGGFRLHNEQKNQVTLHRYGFPEMKRIRERELGDSFSRHLLIERLDRAQMESLLCIGLSKVGFRI